jgi:hypothetical protein
MPAKGYKKSKNLIPRAEGEGVQRRGIYLRDRDCEHLTAKYGSVSNGIRELVAADRRATENAEYKKR